MGLWSSSAATWSNSNRNWCHLFTGSQKCKEVAFLFCPLLLGSSRVSGLWRWNSHLQKWKLRAEEVGARKASPTVSLLGPWLLLEISFCRSKGCFVTVCAAWWWFLSPNASLPARKVTLVCISYIQVGSRDNFRSGFGSSRPCDRHHSHFLGVSRIFLPTWSCRGKSHLALCSSQISPGLNWEPKG